MAKRDGVGECSDEVMMPRAYRHALTRSRATGGLRGDEAATPGVDLGGHRHPGQDAVAGDKSGVESLATRQYHVPQLCAILCDVFLKGLYSCVLVSTAYVRHKSNVYVGIQYAYFTYEPNNPV